MAESKTTILIIEDDKFLSSLLERKLGDEGFEVFTALDAEEGLKILKKHEINLILLDLLLPGIHGFKFLETIKKEPAIKDIPVTILSNLGQKEDIEKGLALGANSYIVKAALTLDEIVVKINEVLRKAGNQRPA